MIIILGKTCSGKDTILNDLTIRGCKKIVTYTTRPRRDNEVDGSAYHFISEKEFKDKIYTGFFAEYQSYNATFGKCYYGSALEDYKNATCDTAIILNPEGFRDIKHLIGIPSYHSVYLKVSDNTIRQRAVKRGDYPEEIERRLLHDNKDFKGLEDYVDDIINCDNVSRNYIVDNIMCMIITEILGSMNIATKNSRGEYRNTYDILSDVADKWTITLKERSDKNN